MAIGALRTLSGHLSDAMMCHSTRREHTVLRGAIVGFGTIAQGHLRGYQEVPGLAVTTVVDSCAARRDAARSVGLDAYPSLGDLLDEFVPDFIDVCTPPDSHHLYVLAAVGRKIPVLCEKPVFVPCEAGYDAIREFILSSGAIVYPCQNYKFAPVFNRVAEAISGGVIGTAVRVYIAVVRAGHALGVADWYPDWRRDPVVSYGGILRDHGPHSVYLATSLTGLVPCSVSCVLGLMSQAGRWSTEDTVLLRLRCEGGADVEISLTWSASIRDSRYTFVGTAGYISVENDELTVSSGEGTTRTRVSSEFDDPSHRAWFAAMLRDFESAVTRPGEQGERVRALLEESMLTTAVIDAGYASARNGGAWRDLS